MICAYCGKEAKGTKEHIISSGILGLFPECFATIDGERSIVHQGDPMVKDVCADCNNNRISYIDSYAKEFIEKYFLVKYKKDDTLSVEYDYTMIQKMCLKFAFNDLRARKKDVSFFDDEVKEYYNLGWTCSKHFACTGLYVWKYETPLGRFATITGEWYCHKHRL